MFNKLFGTNNKNFDVDSTTNAVEDSQSIRQTIDYYILRAAWDEYVAIKKQDPDYLYGDTTPTPAWRALEKVEEYDGDFSQFTDEEQHLLRALRKGFHIYADVLHVLIDHHSDTEAAKELYEMHPQIHEHLPPEYNTPERMIEVLIEVVKDYQWQLEHFAMKHGDAIDGVVTPSARGQVLIPQQEEIIAAEETGRSVLDQDALQAIETPKRDTSVLDQNAINELEKNRSKH